ncbi:MAG: glycosyltransferase family 9 protein [Pseudomonadota bacterium]
MKAKQFKPKRIIVIATRQIGDVLLVTPLLHSLRNAYPNATIELLGYHKKCAMLTGNNDINTVIEVVENPTLQQSWQLFKKIFRRYDLAITTLHGDKPHIYAWFASRYRIGVVEDNSKKTFLKRLSCQQWVLLDNLNTHTILQNLKLAECLEIPCLAEVQLPKLKTKLGIPFPHYAIIHPLPMWHYKRWTTTGWKEVIEHLLAKDIKVLISGSPETQEKELCEQLASYFPEDKVQSLAGKIQIAELGNLLKTAECYIGPDTSITHMSAASGCPTIAIYGPSNVVKWGPWPAGYTKTENPFIQKKLPWQQQNNVIIIQAEDFPCLPCYEEGCDRHKKSHSKCMQELGAKNVLRAIDKLLEGKAPQS